MAAYGFASPAVGNNLPSGIIQVTTDIANGVPNTASMTDLVDTKFTQTHSFGMNQKGMERVHAILAEASWKFNLMDGTNIPKLQNFSEGYHNTALTLVDGDVVVFGNSTVGHNGVPKWKLVIEGGAEVHRYVEMSLRRKAVLASATASILDNDIIWSTFTSAASTELFSGATYRSASGVKKFYVRNTGETNWEELGEIANTSFTAELICDEHEEGFYIPQNNIAIQYSIDVKAVTPTNLALLDTFHQVASNDCKFQLMDNVLISCVDNLGAVADAIVEGDTDKSRILKLHGSGRILLGDWTGLFS